MTATFKRESNPFGGIPFDWKTVAQDVLIDYVLRVTALSQVELAEELGLANAQMISTWKRNEPDFQMPMNQRRHLCRISITEARPFPTRG